MKLGRNDPCHCGSGKKYKHCHYEADRAAEAQALREAAEARAAEARASADEETDDEDDEAVDPNKHDKQHGSRFFRDTQRGGGNAKGQTGGGNRSSRVSRGAQRGG